VTLLKRHDEKIEFKKHKEDLSSCPC
jgi:hypothetical protein